MSILQTFKTFCQEKSQGMRSYLENKNKKVFALVALKENIIYAIEWVARPEETHIQNFYRKEYNSQEKESFKEALGDILSHFKADEVTLLVTIPGHKVSSRILELPSLESGEIENMISLQIPKLMPFSAQEIITGYKIVETTKEGCSLVNVVLVQKTLIKEYVEAFAAFSFDIDALFMDIYGTPRMVGLNNVSSEQESIIIFCNHPLVEIAITKGNNIFLSRCIKMHTNEDLNTKLAKEVLETQSLYVRITDGGPLKKIRIIGPQPQMEMYKNALTNSMVIPVEVFTTDALILENRELKQEIINNVPEALGVILSCPSDTLNLLPKEEKLKKRRKRLTRYKAKLFGIVFISVVIFIMGFLKLIANKRSYLKTLERTLTTVYAQAKDLEVMAKRLRTVRAADNDRRQILDFFDAVHTLEPTGIFVTHIQFDANEKVHFLVRGSSQSNASVFDFAQLLKEDERIAGLSVKVNYTRVKTTRTGEIIEFEIFFLDKNI